MTNIPAIEFLLRAIFKVTHKKTPQEMVARECSVAVWCSENLLPIWNWTDLKTCGNHYKHVLCRNRKNLCIDLLHIEFPCGCFVFYEASHITFQGCVIQWLVKPCSACNAKKQSVNKMFDFFFKFQNHWFPWKYVSRKINNFRLYISSEYAAAEYPGLLNLPWAVPS